MADDGRSFVSRFEDRALAAPAEIFARFQGDAITFGELHRRALAVAAGLRAKGIRPGDHVAVLLDNSPDALAVILGLARAGAAWIPVNTRQRGEGLRHILGHSAPRLVVAEAHLAATIAASGADLGGAPLVLRGDPAAAHRLEQMSRGDGAVVEPAPPADALLAVMYTSGTTGPPKGVMVTHRMLEVAGEAVAQVSDVRDGDTMYLWEPLYHIGGAQILVVPQLRRVTIAMTDRFSATRFWPEVVAAGATHVHYLGGILQILLKQPPGPLDRAHRVRIAWGGGCPPEFWRDFEARFGVAVRECYGMTEASSISTMNLDGVLGSVGRPPPWFSVDVLDERGQPVPRGTNGRPGPRGEIVVSTSRPGAIFRGYLKDPTATAKALRGGALHTGDCGSLDSRGNLYFHGRLNDSVRCRGENVSAWEVEHVASSHPDVEDCAIVGVAAEIGEQDIKLLVKAKPGATVDPAALSEWLDGRLAPHQQPRYIAAVDEFERTPSQRIMKHRLSRDVAGCWDRAAAEAARGHGRAVPTVRGR